MNRLRVCWLVLALVVGFAHAGAAAERTVVVVMIDGFPARLLSLAEVPAFKRLLPQSVWSDQLLPAFPSLSHTNWATITTGCWPERHGIVGNAFEIDGEPATRDEILDADALLGCEPLHAVAEAQGARAAALGWTASRSATRGPMASIVEPYFETWTARNDERRARQVLDLLALPDAERPRLILAYFSGPDGAQHNSGMLSDSAREAIEHTDRAMGVLLDGLEAFKRTAPATLLVVTDHGMMDIDGLINVQKLLEEYEVSGRPVVDGPLGFVHLDDPAEREQAIARMSGDERFDVVRPEAQPPHFRLGRSPRLGDFMLYAKPGWFFPNDHDMPDWVPTYTRWWPTAVRIPSWIQRIGMHGYAVEEVPEMAGFFLAWGDGIRRPGPLEEAVRAIDIHPTVARLLGIRSGRPVDGRVLDSLLSVAQ